MSTPIDRGCAAAWQASRPWRDADTWDQLGVEDQDTHRDVIGAALAAALRDDGRLVELVARTAWETSRKDEGTISATGAQIVAVEVMKALRAHLLGGESR